MTIVVALSTVGMNSVQSRLISGVYINYFGNYQLIVCI